MDTVTQALLGATVAQAAAIRPLGRRALAWGAVGGVLPDLDVVAVATHGPFGEFLYHRGVTHALWFGPVVGVVLGWAVWRWYAWRGTAGPPGRPPPGAPGLAGAWCWVFVLALGTHPWLDAFTAYGTQLLAPFSDVRVAWNGVAIIDPLYTLVLVAAVVVGAARRTRPTTAVRAAGAALVVSSAYLLYGVHLNAATEAQAARLLAAEGAPAARVRAYPTLLQPWLRRVVARDPGGEVRVGLHTMLEPDRIYWERFREPTHPLIARTLATREGTILTWFAMGEITGRVQPTADGWIVEVHDLRYGFPGAPDEGLWGIRAAYDGGGRLLGPIERFDQPRDAAARARLRALWRAVWGDFTTLRRAPPG